MPLVAFEGIDGSGKSTALKAVASALRKEGVKAIATREETDGPTGAAVRRSIRERWDAMATTFLFAADRARHVAELAPHLASGRLVLSDRFVDSTYAYQSVTLQDRLPDALAFLRSLHDGWCPVPERVLLFTCDVEEAVRRTRRRGARTPYEKVAFLARVQAVYEDLARAEPERFVAIDAGRPAAQVAADATAAVRSLLGARPPKAR